MTNTRMSTVYMLKYCNEALECPDFGSIDRFFFESVKRIILGQCEAVDTSYTPPGNIPGFDGLVSVDFLENFYKDYSDIYYGDNDDDIPDFS